jgi:hypothetical protein
LDVSDAASEADAQETSPPPAFGTPVPLVTAEDGPMGIVLAPGKIFWTVSGSAVVRAASRTADGGAGVASTFTALATPTPAATDLVGDDAGHLYALVGPLYAQNGCQTVQVVSALAPGGTSFCEAISSQPVVRVAVDSVNVYLSAYAVVGTTNAPTIVYIPKPGTNEPPSMWASYANESSRVEAMASDGGTLYFAVTNRIYAQPIAGGSAVLFAKATADVNDLGVDGQQVYWLTADGGVYAASKATPGDGGSATPIPLATGQGGPIRLALDTANIYWTNEGDGTIGAAGKQGQFYEQIAHDQGAPYGIAVDQSGVYWTATNDGTIMMAPL